ncbi:DUF4278 domain-containing protein [Aerosakkonemataceae cyanobacterium BLCC-F50]|uniref:DUF4278 domain-containing protein n=1 Tax=Floridaenema flaviceps BLCC-F50 TaxID=3153642 RepID=A0ABV4XWZ8_9CYAN
MKLKYRGNFCPPSAHVETVGTTIIGQFRGLSYQVRQSDFKNSSQPKINLKYRGVPYYNESSFNHHIVESLQCPLLNEYKPIS